MAAFARPDAAPRPRFSPGLRWFSGPVCGCAGLKSSLFSYLWPWRHAGLIAQFASREVQARYRQSWLGTLWALLTPLLMLAVFTFVLRFVFKLRWAGEASGVGDESDLLYALRVYAGLAVFYFFSECVSRAPRLILDQPHLVKKVIFPLEILPWVSTLASFVQLGVGMLVLLGLSAWAQGGLPLTVVALPLVWLGLLPLCVGLGWLLAALGTFVRDVVQVVGLVLSLLMFLSPVFFPLEALPQAAMPWALLNPLAIPITLTREVVLEGLWPRWELWLLHVLASLCLAMLSALFFSRARRGFADVV